MRSHIRFTSSNRAWRTFRDRKRDAGKIEGEGTDFIDRGGIGLAQLARGLDGGCFGGAVDDIETEQLLLRFCKRSVDHERRVAVLAQGRGRRGRQEPGDRPELALTIELFHDGPKLGHDGIIVLLAPGTGHLFIVVAENGIEHVGGFLF